MRYVPLTPDDPSNHFVINGTRFMKLLVKLHPMEFFGWMNPSNLVLAMNSRLLGLIFYTIIWFQKI